MGLTALLKTNHNRAVKPEITKKTTTKKNKSWFKTLFRNNNYKIKLEIQIFSKSIKKKSKKTC
jgi:hypothetical protein